MQYDNLITCLEKKNIRYNKNCKSSSSTCKRFKTNFKQLQANFSFDTNQQNIRNFARAGLAKLWKRFDLFSDNQFGFREKHSTTLAITHSYE